MRSSAGLRAPSPALAVALLALFAALGGTASALVVTGSSIKDGSVGEADIRDGSLRGKDVRNGSLRGRDLGTDTVTARQVRDGALLADDFAPGQLPTGPRGRRGAGGPQGDAGPSGPPGVPGIVGRVVVQGSSVLGSQPLKTATVNCLPGTEVIGTGFWLDIDTGGSLNQLAVGAARTISDTQVAVSAHEVAPVSVDWVVVAEAVCGRVAS
jgi:hypothetical protein